MFERLGNGFSRLRALLVETDNIRLMLIIIAILVIISYGLPRSPGFSRLQDGIECTRLSHPPGGNQRSILAVKSDNQTIELEIRILNEMVDSVGDPLVRGDEPLQIRVIFKNEDSGPVYLYYRENEEVIQPFSKSNPPNNVAGVVFTIEALDRPTTTILNDPGRQPVQPKQNYDLEDIYVLQSKNRCSLDFEITRGQMQRMNMTAGKYQMRVYYRNVFPGIPDHAVDATATPMFDDAGVWTGIAESSAIRFTVEAATPVPAG